MINLKKYSFNKYSEKYKRLFNDEKTKLRNIFPKSKIEHVGSSSVIGLDGKGIIDIAISVQKKEIQNAINELQGNGYNYFLSSNNKERYFFQKIIRYSKKERRVHIQLTYHNSKTWNSMIAVRNYLRKNKVLIKEYTQVKKEAIKYAKGDGKKYRDYKKHFLQKIEKLALEDYFE